MGQWVMDASGFRAPRRYYGHMSDPSIPTPSEAPAFYEWNGETWYYNKRKGYYYSRDGFLLHRALWIKINGPIPDGFDVHHRNRKRWDCALENLCIISKSEHSKLTWQERTDPDRFDSAGRSRRSSEGLKRMWERRQPLPVVCIQCGETFYSTGMRSKLCSDACRREYGRIQSANKRAARRAGK